MGAAGRSRLGAKYLRFGTNSLARLLRNGAAGLLAVALLLVITGDKTRADAAATAGVSAQTPAEADRASSGYVDNHDGTITDPRTGLMWEKLTTDGSVHDVTRLYTWHEAIEAKIATLNSGGFAGYKDWRLPSVVELQGLVDYGRAYPAVDPIFNSACNSASETACSRTQPFHYWTSTTCKTREASAWLVSFDAGYVVTDVKSNMYYARAVRGR